MGTPGRILSNLEDIGLETVTMNIVDKKKPDLPDFGELARGNHGWAYGRA